MQIDTTVHGDHVVVRCEGRLTMVAAPSLRSTVENCVAEGHPRVVVDLSPTTFVDSSGLGALVNGLKATRVAGGDLRIAGAPEQVRSVLQLTNLDRVLKPYADVGEATDGW
ncbi:STAS domain-containing protein [Nocardioides sp. Y6]|uniref:Anti-sigma factor antagonist n=1 Tax=Nocardioides malaquae TaxID=2773426 RepID=A0ABR9RQS8_9ACTN|nr:STAS domain-containing protein [Nocardioides malaquae]MBE7323520.1 STAS domain-containing protein [Nocardioides malaquae]